MTALMTALMIALMTALMTTLIFLCVYCVHCPIRTRYINTIGIWIFSNLFQVTVKCMVMSTKLLYAYVLFLVNNQMAYLMLKN